MDEEKEVKGEWMEGEMVETPSFWSEQVYQMEHWQKKGAKRTFEFQLDVFPLHSMRKQFHIPIVPDVSKKRFFF